MNLARLRRILRNGAIATLTGRGLTALLVCVGLIAVGVASASAADSQPHAAGVDRGLSGDSGPAVHHDKSPPLRSITPRHTPGKAYPAKPIPPGPAALSHTSAPNTAGKAASQLAPTAGTSFDGLGISSANNPCNCAPPDNDVAAGPTQVVELVNSELGVYSKTGGTLIQGESTNTLWSGFGGGCESNNDGDGTVTYDTIAQRWVIQQFSVSTTPFLDCVAISTSSDATGTYNRYSFQYSAFPDYPKLGVWSDGYYLSFNRFNGNTFLGPEVCAFDRTAMLAGSAASQQCFTPSSYLGSLLPATLDGTTAPPSGEAEWFVGINPNAANSLAYFKFHVDWATPSNTTLTGPTSLAVNAFSELCGGDATCVPQSGTRQQLDSLGDRLMWRLAYRNFGDHEAMVVTHSVLSGTAGALRWYELRPNSGSLSVFQQGTYAPNSTYRWMGSIALDRAGDMGLGYSTSSSALHPGVGYTGRVPADTAGAMETPETTMFTGAGSQTRNLSRWGDYSEMSVDPSDDCTFWYVNEYLPSNGTFNWHTRIGSFKFSGCGSSGGSAPTVTTGSFSNLGTTTATISGTVNPNGQSTTYQFDYGTSTSYGSHSPASPGSAGAGTSAVPESANLTGLSPSTTYHYRIEATNATGTTFGSDQTFTTSGIAPTVTTGSFSNLGTTTATISGTVNPNGQSTTYQFDYGTSTSYGSQSPASPGSAGSGTSAVPESANLTGLSPGTTYHYRIEATNATGTTFGSDQTFTTSGAAPIVTTGGSSNLGNTTATISGTVNPNGQSTTYQFDYGTSTSYGSQSPASPGSAGSGTTDVSESADLTGLSPGTTYHYRIEATNATGTSFGADQTFTTTNGNSVGSPSGPTQSPQGTWVGTYGSSGYDLAAWNGGSDVVSMSGASVTLLQGARYEWASSTTQVRALENAAGTQRALATYYDPNQVQVQLNFSSAFNGTLALYAVDGDSTARRETITVGNQTATLSSDFSQGAWVTYPITASAGSTLTITVNRTAGNNAVLSGIFLG